MYQGYVSVSISRVTKAQREAWKNRRDKKKKRNKQHKKQHQKQHQQNKPVNPIWKNRNKKQRFSCLSDRQKKEKLDSNPTPSESRLKSELSRQNIAYTTNEPFYYMGHPYFVDFWLSKYKLAIEVDGGYHNTPEQRAKDRIRQERLKTYHSVDMIRFTNGQVKKELDKVIFAIKTKIGTNN